MRRLGFTLVEVIACVVLLSLLAGAVLVVLSATVRDAERLSARDEAASRSLSESAWAVLRQDIIEERAIIAGTRFGIDFTPVQWNVVDGVLYRQRDTETQLVAVDVDAINATVNGKIATVFVDLGGRRETRKVVLR